MSLEQAMKDWELEKLAKELDYTLLPNFDTPEQLDVCEHDLEMGYCPVKDCEGGL